MFSELEFYQAFVRFLPETEARRLAREFSGNDIDSSAITTLPRPNPKELIGAYSDDVLLALSFVSPETEQKVERFRRSRAHGNLSSTDQANWIAARQRFEKMIEEVKRRRASGNEGSS